MGRKSLNIYSGAIFAYATAKRNRLYCIKKVENGYKEFVIYIMKWEYLKLESDKMGLDIFEINST